LISPDHPQVIKSSVGRKVKADIGTWWAACETIGVIYGTFFSEGGCIDFDSLLLDFSLVRNLIPVSSVKTWSVILSY